MISTLRKHRCLLLYIGSFEVVSSATYYMNGMVDILNYDATNSD